MSVRAEILVVCRRVLHLLGAGRTGPDEVLSYYARKWGQSQSLGVLTQLAGLIHDANSVPCFLDLLAATRLVAGVLAEPGDLEGDWS